MLGMSGQPAGRTADPLMEKTRTILLMLDRGEILRLVIANALLTTEAAGVRVTD
jgi:hypothetical protein